MAKGVIETQKTESQFRSNLLLGLIIVLVLILGIISLFTGVYDIFNNDGVDIFLITRVPRTIALMLTGSAMALSGFVMQLMTQNKFVEPTTTGSIEWAGLGLVVAYIIFDAPSLVVRMGMAILFAFLGTLLFFILLSKIKLKSSLIVPIFGLMLGAIISSISSFVGLTFNMTQSLEIWFAGSFAPIQRGRYEYLFIILIITAIIYFMASRLTVIGLGKDMATNLGINYSKTILIGTMMVALCVGVVSSVVGNLPFIGLIVPNIVSLYRGDNLRSNLVWVCLLGMIVITTCDIVARVLIMPFEIPVSLILGIIGSIVFIYLLLKVKRRDSVE